MTKTQLNRLYFDWMYHLVSGRRPRGSKVPTYHKLLEYLYETDFDYILPMDGNRFEDGIDLRYRFGRENDYDQYMISVYLDDRPCSVLEMMVALAVRCEDHIMEDPDVGDRVGQWFWEMVVSLGLGSMNDQNYDPDYTQDVIDHFLNRDYEPNGRGGLFTIEDPAEDQRKIDIWYQMCAHLNEIIDESR